MKKKSLLIVLIALCLLFISSTCFATNDIKNSIHSVTNTAVDGTANLGNDVKNGVESTSGAIKNGTKNLWDDISNGVNNMDNTLNISSSNYTAERTSIADTPNTNMMNTNLWTWVALAVAGIVIVGLVWYYATEHDIDR